LYKRGYYRRSAYRRPGAARICRNGFFSVLAIPALLLQASDVAGSISRRLINLADALVGTIAAAYQ
jgi:hypothetical protein